MARSKTNEAPAPERRLPYPRRCDAIGRAGHGLFLSAVVLGVGVTFAWAATTELDKVVRGPGRIVPQLQNKLVQHLEGGIVTEILVREGDRVEAGTPLLRIENTFFRSELAQARLDRRAKLVKLARLTAELSESPTLSVPPDLQEGVPQIVDREVSLLGRRLANLREQLAILNDQSRQKEIELSELRARKPTVERERDITQERLDSYRKLQKIGAISANEVLEADRALQQAMGRLSDIAHDIPRTEYALHEVEQRRRETISRFKSEAERDRSQTALEVEKLDEAIMAMSDRNRRAEITAPIAGIINRLNVTTVGGVVKPGEALAQIVPADANIGVEMRLAPSDRAEVRIGERAVVKVSAYEYSVYGTMPGWVSDVSPDALIDERGQPYFRVRLEADGTVFGKDKPVVPGMVADVDVIAGRQTILSYLLTPLKRVRDSAFRE